MTRNYNILQRIIKAKTLQSKKLLASRGVFGLYRVHIGLGGLFYIGIGTIAEFVVVQYRVKISCRVSCIIPTLNFFFLKRFMYESVQNDILY